MRRRHLLASATGLATASFAAAPLVTGLPRPALAQAEGGRRLRFVPSVDLSTIDPLWSAAVVAYTHGYMVWDTLYGLTLDQQPQPQMCEGHTLSEDRRVWTFNLREGLLFHDGEPVRAVDCIASLRRWMEKDPFGQSIAAILVEAKALDDRRFQLALSKPFGLLLFAIAARSVFVMPERIAKTPASQQIKEVIGSGPYRFLADEWQTGAHAGYACFDRYRPRAEAPDMMSGGKQAHFDRIDWITQPDPATAAAALQRGEVDWVERPLLDLLPMLRKSAGVKTDKLDVFGALGILRFNQLLPPFDNPKLRQALLPGVIQEEVVAAAVGEEKAYGNYPVGFFPEGSPMANDAGLGALSGPRDLARARQLVKEAGYKGERIVMMAPSDLAQIMAASQVMLDQLTKMGLNIDFQVMDWGTMLSRMAKKDPIDQGGWNCFVTTWASLSVATPGSSYPLRSAGASSWAGWPDDPKLEALRGQWMDAPDTATAQAICREIQQEAFTSLPYIPIGQWTSASAYRDTLSGPLKAPYALFWNVRKNA